MGFLSYHLNYYCDALERLESGTAEEGSVYHARQLLKLLDDLADEGYYTLNDTLEERFQGVARLRTYLKKNHAVPFPSAPFPRESAMAYACEELELCAVLRSAADQAGMISKGSQEPFLDELCRFCRFVGYEEDTAYLFLLRDTLLPFVRYQAQGCARIYPWLLSRRSFAQLTGEEGADDLLRAAIYRALESGRCADFTSFRRFVLPELRTVLQRYPSAEQVLRGMLQKIREPRIVVVESGCCGTFPLLLMSLDERVDLRMYTTYPYLADIYRGFIYTIRYEDVRRFETLSAHEYYLRYSSLRDGRFYVQKCTDAGAERRALAEIRTMLRDTDQF